MTEAAIRLTDRLRSAVEGRDAAALMQLYADDAVMTVVDRNNPPSKPLVLTGKAAIAAHLSDICGRPMTHRVENAVEQNGRIAFTQACQHQDGWRVLCATVAELDGGRIARQTNVQAWDG
jgi:ketosteroid isomerase-like protein